MAYVLGKKYASNGYAVVSVLALGCDTSSHRGCLDGNGGTIAIVSSGFWCPTDSPANSGWRANTPVGIWTNGTFYRKHAYAGIVRGLGGVDHSGIADVTAAAPNSTVTGIYSLSGFRYPADTRYEDLPSGIYIINGKVIRK